ncbi:Reverse transcriptase domain protein [Lasiodiplodia theobromae]|uniref:Reverse transcriptase domain protein n=1 Tax=Lasiodiplodia theobromae TaxID=45133 RepID=UPI0015C30EBE|nr:Reverse transcriptase domain protein [Lasiodiplodia theobromae]KAF4539175.1 Reverse transcriptase domain protein [Lasiodiplodia theobromae]
MFDRLGRARVFTKLDLRDAYHRLRIRSEDEWKTAFKTRYGHFEYLVMPFGLANAPATFQSYIHRAMGGLLDHICVVYLDDILIYSENEKDHVQHVNSVLQRLGEWGLYAKLSKCVFHTKTVEFLGFVVTPEGIVMDPERVKAIQEWPTPESYRDVQVFLGFANFYRRFIWNYSEIARPLNDLLRSAARDPAVSKSKDKRKQTRKGPTKWYMAFQWSADVEHAFRKLRVAFSQAPVLRHFDPTRPLMLVTDALDFAIGGILLQPWSTEGTQQHWLPVAYHSRKLVGPEVNYPTHDKELLAIVESFRTWRHYLAYAPVATRVLSDHKNLEYFMTAKSLSPRQARYAEDLAQYDFEIEYKPGSGNPADPLLRRPDFERGFKLDAKRTYLESMLPTLPQKLRVRDLTGALSGATTPPTREACETHASDPRAATARRHPLLPEADVGAIQATKRNNATPDPACEKHAWAQRIAGTSYAQSCVPRREAVVAATGETAFEDSPPQSLADFIRAVQEQDPLVRSLARQSLEEQASAGYAFDRDGLLRQHHKVWVPNCAPLKDEIMKRNHDDLVGGHYGYRRTLEALERKYVWENLTQDLKTYLKACDACQRHKSRRHKPYGTLQPLEPEVEPWKHFSMDFVTDLPESTTRDGVVFDPVLVLVDRFTKLVQYFPVRKSIDAEGLAHLLFKTFARTGPPYSLVSDRGSVFTSEYWSEVCFILRVRLRFSTAFHPQTDGQTERQNQELETYLRIYVNFEQNDWAEWLDQAAFAYNSKIHSVTGVTPIQLAYGAEPAIPDGIADPRQAIAGGDEAHEKLLTEGREPSALREAAAKHAARMRLAYTRATEAIAYAQEL